MKNTLILFCLLNVGSSLHAECKKVTAEGFAGLLAPPKKRIVFFASWCKSCAQHLTDDYAADSIFVASFDQQSAANQTLDRFFKGKAVPVTCVWDEDGAIGEKYGLKYLPLTINI